MQAEDGKAVPEIQMDSTGHGHLSGQLVVGRVGGTARDNQFIINGIGARDMKAVLTDDNNNSITVNCESIQSILARMQAAPAEPPAGSRSGHSDQAVEEGNYADIGVGSEHILISRKPGQEAKIDATKGVHVQPAKDGGWDVSLSGKDVHITPGFRVTSTGDADGIQIRVKRD